MSAPPAALGAELLRRADRAVPGPRLFASARTLYTRSVVSSNYAYCGGNPVNGVDPSGLQVGGPAGWSEESLKQYGKQYAEAIARYLQSKPTAFMTPEQAFATPESQNVYTEALRVMRSLGLDHYDTHAPSIVDLGKGSGQTNTLTGTVSLNPFQTTLAEGVSYELRVARTVSVLSNELYHVKNPTDRGSGAEERSNQLSYNVMMTLGIAEPRYSNATLNEIGDLRRAGLSGPDPRVDKILPFDPNK